MARAPFDVSIPEDLVSLLQHGTPLASRPRSPIHAQIIRESIAANRVQRDPVPSPNQPRDLKPPEAPKRQRFTKRPRYGDMQATFNASDMSQLAFTTQPDPPAWSCKSSCVESENALPMEAPLGPYADSPQTWSSESLRSLTDDPLWQRLEELQEGLPDTSEELLGHDELPSRGRDDVNSSETGFIASISDFPEDRPLEDPELLLHPEVRPISQKQLISEVKGIYAGLVLVEAKCIDVDRRSATASVRRDKDLTQTHAEMWESLFCLHRDLLSEYHDFFMATQHPIASAALRSLANEFAMSDRMWRHGIESFLQLYPTTGSRAPLVSFAEYARTFAELLGSRLPEIGREMNEIQAAIEGFMGALERGDRNGMPLFTQEKTPGKLNSLAPTAHDISGPKPSDSPNLQTPRAFNEKTSFGDIFHVGGDSNSCHEDWYQRYTALAGSLTENQDNEGEGTEENSRSEEAGRSLYSSDSCLVWTNQMCRGQANKTSGPSRYIVDLLIGWIFYGQSIASHSFGLYNNVFQVLKLAIKQRQHWPILDLRVAFFQACRE